MPLITKNSRVYAAGEGRSGFQARSFAMRMMHTPNSYSARRSAWRLRPGSCRQSPNTRVTKFVTVFQYTTGAVLALME